MSPLRNAVLGGAAVLALSFGAALAAETTTTTTTSADGKTMERRVVIMQSGGPGGDVMYDSAAGGPGPHAMMMRMGHHDPEHMAKHLRDVLQLTPAQEPALKDFLASMAPPPHPEGEREHRIEVIAKGPDGKPDMTKLHEQMAKLHADFAARKAEMEKKHAEEAALPTPEKLDRMVRRMAEESAKHQAELQKHVDAVKRFYSALTPSQQKAFDALAGAMMHHMGGGMMDGHGGPGMRVRMMGMGAMPPMPPLPPLPPAPPPPPGE